MKTKIYQLQTLMGYLRNVAEVDPSDQISNAASSLAARLEAAGANKFSMSAAMEHWSPLDRAVAEYAVSKRRIYILPIDARHAVNLATYSG
jgi:hypothetical protein